MGSLFKARSSKLGSLVSLVAVTAMLALYSLSLPEFLLSPAGRIFAVVWAAAAIAVFVVHARRVAEATPQRAWGQERPRTEVPLRKETQRDVRPLRG